MWPKHPHQQYQRPPWGQSFANSVVGRLILANVVVFVLQQLFPPVFTVVFALTPRAVVEHFYVWQLGTYMFLHGGFMHLFFNMLILFIFGSTLEMVWGGRQFIKYYLACGVGAGLFSIIFSYNHPVVGASGAIFGLYLAYAMVFPNNYVYLYFLIPVKAKHLVAGLVVFQLAMGLSGPSGIAYFAHLGGMATGLLFFRSAIRDKFKLNLGAKRRWNTYQRERRDRQDEHETENIDSILDKISAKGYENLSTTEKRILENYSRKRNQESDED
jgi:membrane associated rhomboid family serine protease